jgi:hypothetical protein
MQTDSATVEPYLQRELKPGEQLLWSGRPDLARRVKNTGSVNTSYIIYSVLAIAMVFLIIFDIHLLTYESTFSSRSDPFTIFLLLIGIVLLGLYLYRIYALFNVTQKSNNNLRNTIYGITNQRVIVMTSTGQSFAVKSHAQSDIGQIIRTETSEGWGDVSYGIPHSRQVGWRTVASVDKLVGVPNARLVEDILIRTFKSPSAPPQQTWYAQLPVATSQAYPPVPQQYMPQPSQPQE